jgi:hypothetical protein
MPRRQAFSACFRPRIGALFWFWRSFWFVGLEPMPQAPERAGIHQTLYTHRDFFAQIAFDLIVMLDNFAEFHNLVFTEVLDPNCSVHAGFLENLQRRGPPNAVDIGQPDIGSLVSRQINSSYTRHINSSFLAGPVEMRPEHS